MVTDTITELNRFINNIYNMYNTVYVYFIDSLIHLKQNEFSLTLETQYFLMATVSNTTPPGQKWSSPLSSSCHGPEGQDYV